MTANIEYSSFVLQATYWRSLVTSSSSSGTRARAHTDRSSFLLFNQTERGVDSNSREKHLFTALLHQRRRRRRRTFFGVCVEIDFLIHITLRGKNAPIYIKEFSLKDGGHIDTRTTTTDELSRDAEEETGADKRNR